MVMSVGNMEAGFVSYLADHVFQTIKLLELPPTSLSLIVLSKMTV